MEVSVEVVIDDGPHAGPGRHTALRLIWAPADPCAVRLRLTAHPEHPALPRGEWVVLREVLRDGLIVPTGDGAVRVRPDELRDRVWFELDRPGRPGCISVPRAVVAGFVARTEDQVPCGSEGTEHAVNLLLDRVLYSS
jgi:hypothetical protein